MSTDDNTPASAGVAQRPAAAPVAAGQPRGAVERRQIATLQPRLRELGRIRLGHRVEGQDGKLRPQALDSFRFTSRSQRLIEAAATRYGGQPEPWQPPEGQPQFQVVVDVDEIDVHVPPVHQLSQAYELWKAGGCQRRCDGMYEELSDRPCLCPDDHQERAALASAGAACQITTRLNVIVSELPDLGVWRVESHGWHAASELAGVAAVLDLAAATNRLLPARIRIDRREIKRPGEPRKRFVVPIVELLQPLAAVLEQAGAGSLPGAPAVAGIRGAPSHDNRPALEQAPPQPVDVDDRGDLVRLIRSSLNAARIPVHHVDALLRFRYQADSLDGLTTPQLQALHGKVSTDDGLVAFTLAAASDHAAAIPHGVCVSCGATDAELDTTTGECVSCAIPF
jgi:hypothetical protein